MPNVLAMSFEGEMTPCFDLRCVSGGHRPPDGWGLSWYPSGEPSAAVLKEPAPPERSIRAEVVKAGEQLSASLFVLHIRTATWGHISNANTQPFRRSWGARDWLIAHSGSLKHRLALGDKPRFEPVGSTDTELIFCELLSLIASRGWRSIGDMEPDTLRSFFDGMNDHGSLTTVLADGRDLAVYADRNDEGPAYVWQLLPPYGPTVFGDDELDVDLTRRGIKSRKGVIVCSSPLSPRTEIKPAWQKLPPGHLLVVRQGAVRAEVRPPPRGLPEPPPVVEPAVDLATGRAPTSFIAAHRGSLKVPTRAQVRRYDIVHRTAYRYDRPVERSTHLLRLMPTHDTLQSVLAHSLTVSVDGSHRDYEDVFGNHARRMTLETRYHELVIEARSRVEVRDVDPLNFRALHTRTTIPLVWMPWQRQVLQPFLLPPELPESELTELVEYAMSFVERNDYDLLDTLLDLNSSIYKEYQYRQGSTTLFTTPFEVYANRRGVCQDFTNLFICLARLLGIPARYNCGYIYTGPRHDNQRQSEASHAWLQVYLPEVGWKGFDPTNGVLTQTDHVRVAVGRAYGDATPTSGTIYVGGGRETLEVDVRVDLLGAAEAPDPPALPAPPSGAPSGLAEPASTASPSRPLVGERARVR